MQTISSLEFVIFLIFFFGVIFYIFIYLPGRKDRYIENYRSKNNLSYVQEVFEGIFYFDSREQKKISLKNAKQIIQIEKDGYIFRLTYLVSGAGSHGSGNRLERSLCFLFKINPISERFYFEKRESVIGDTIVKTLYSGTLVQSIKTNYNDFDNEFSSYGSSQDKLEEVVGKFKDEVIESNLVSKKLNENSIFNMYISGEYLLVMLSGRMSKYIEELLPLLRKVAHKLI